MKIYLFLADGFEEIEAIAPVDIFRRAGIEVVTVSVNQKTIVTGAHAIPVMADKIFEETEFTGDYTLFLPGGLPGTYNLDAHKGLHALLEKQAAEGKNIAAICAAPSILGKKGLLRGREAICYPGFEDKLEGATISEETMVKAGNIFTAKAAGVAVHFALAIVAELKGVDVAAKIQQGICLD